MFWSNSGLFVALALTALVIVLAVLAGRRDSLIRALGGLKARLLAQAVVPAEASPAAEPESARAQGQEHGGELLEELRKLNDVMNKFSKLALQYLSEVRQEETALLERFNLLLQLQETQCKAITSSVQLQRELLDRLGDIASNDAQRRPAAVGEAPARVVAAARAEPLPVVAVAQATRPESVYTAPLEKLPTVTRQSAADAMPLEKFIADNIERINKAAYEGVGGIRNLVSGTGIEVYEHSDVVFILRQQGEQRDYDGKAFVLPGQLLSRPWSEWFNAEKELVYPVESTVRPASVRHGDGGGWELCERGVVSQR